MGKNGKSRAASYSEKEIDDDIESSQKKYMLTPIEREILINEARMNNNGSASSGTTRGSSSVETVNVGIGSAEQSTNPEISFLFQERRRKKE